MVRNDVSKLKTYSRRIKFARFDTYDAALLDIIINIF